MFAVGRSTRMLFVSSVFVGEVSRAQNNKDFENKEIGGSVRESIDESIGKQFRKEDLD